MQDKIDCNNSGVVKVLDLETISSNIWWNEEVYELVLSWFLCINLQPFFKITCGTNDQLKLTLQKKSDYRW